MSTRNFDIQSAGFAMVFVALFSPLMSGCGAAGAGGTTTGNPVVAPVEDTSTSGIAAEAVGGALSGSESSGNLAGFARHSKGLLISGLESLLPSAHAGNACPTYRTAAGSTCSVSGDTMWLSYLSCQFTGGSTTWNGVQALFSTGGSARCGTFPLPSSSGTLTRQYVGSSGSSTPSSVTLVSSFGTTTTVDDSSNNVGNFDSETIASILNGGYGAQVTFDGTGARTGLALGHHIVVTGVLNHSVTGTMTVEETVGAITRTVQGSVKVYHNLLQVIGTATFSKVTLSDTCCLPISGNITTVFSKGASKEPIGIVGAAMVGQTETLTFTGCGTATLNTYSGTTESVTLSRCF